MPAEYYPVTIFIPPGTPAADVISWVANAGIQYPMVVKPDRGMQGILFRIIENEGQLLTYHQLVPVEYIVQQYVDYPIEVSVFHIRYPNQAKGKLTGFILKEYLSVVGDGKSDLLTLIVKNERATNWLDEMKKKHQKNLAIILPPGHRYNLSNAGNHNRGAKFINLHNEIDDTLRQLFDRISNRCQTFYYGRYDIKCASIEDLKAGKHFSILEFNGTGAEPNHIYDCDMPYWEALAVIARHWRDMFEIGRLNYSAGVPYWTFNRGTLHLIKAKRFWRMLRRYDSKLLTT